ncbi:hypothetical protein ASF60_13915 [Methylobacterium sp. Leaf113]|uniref:Panacea domain-containing protein n=1 Tax=Methylobacterium sp. Leaf113 TaxID=1736259 RepID=UPI0006FF9B01|nr:type II toxin-antitoxin system antitoxin SocA domain-containing protein [Methylobacterium sp. Leaf113]KQP93759.1 hypothetical protein ASF60_13915 [Methylobacterium sp. Leaf113]
MTNLQLQKTLYLAQMTYMGQNDGEPLFEGSFEAWDYGPVEPSLYRKVRMFGSRPVSDVFLDARRFGDDDPRREFLMGICRDLLSKPASELVEITHWEDGAWAKNYVPGARGVQISDEDINQEYHDRLRAGDVEN